MLAVILYFFESDIVLDVVGTWKPIQKTQLVLRNQFKQLLLLEELRVLSSKHIYIYPEESEVRYGILLEWKISLFNFYVSQRKCLSCRKAEKQDLESGIKPNNGRHPVDWKKYFKPRVPLGPMLCLTKYVEKRKFILKNKKQCLKVNLARTNN